MKIAAGALRTPLSSLALSLAITLIARQLHGAAPAHVLPVRCPGITELWTIAVLRTWPSMPLGALLPPLSAVLQVLGTAALVLLVRHTSQNWFIAAAIGLACALLTPFAPALAIPPAVLLLASCVVILAALVHSPDGPVRDGGGAPAGADGWVVIAGLIATGAIHPPSTIPLAVLAAWWSWRHPVVARVSRVTASLAIAAGVLGAGSMTGWLMPGVASATSGVAGCMLAPVRFASVPLLAQPLASMGSEAGPYVLALAAVGATMLFRWRATDAIVFVAAYTAAVAVTAVLPGAADMPLGPNLELPRALVPVLAVTWTLAGLGLAEARRVAGGGVRGHVAAALLIGLVPALQWSAKEERRSSHASSSDPRDHASLSLARLDALLDPLGDGVSLVIDDAGVDLLVRARESGNNPRRLPLAPRDPFALAQVVSAPGRRVYALSFAQRDLQHVGLRLSPVSSTPALVRVELGGHCYRLRDGDWRVLADLTRTTTFGLVARRQDEAGPVVIYATFGAAPEVRAVDWSRAAIRGFHVAVYRPAAAEERARLERDVRDDGVPPTLDWATAPYVARIEQWRTPGTPFVLATALGAQPTAVMGRLKAGPTADITASGITICAGE